MTKSFDQVATFRHEALFYSGWADYVSGTVPFIKEGVRAGEAVLVVESAEKIDMLRTALDQDATAVLFADMSEVGANPARIIPAWRDFVERHGEAGKGLRGIGEPIWKGRSTDEVAECQRHESLLNVAFGGGRPWHLLCPYDAGQLDAAVIEEARRSHEYVTESGAAVASETFRGIAGSGTPFAAPLTEPTTGVRTFRFDTDNLVNLRGEVTRYATAVGLSAKRATELVTAVNEVATNSLLHGGGHGTLRMWKEANSLISEIRDSGRYDRPLADRERPGPNTTDPRGLWLANQLCDLVQIRTLAGGTVVRAHMKIDPKGHLHVVPRA